MHKISTGFAVSVLLVIALTIGGIFWLIGEKNKMIVDYGVQEEIDRDGINFLPTVPTVPKLLMSDASSQVAFLQQKWAVSGLDIWSTRNLFGQDIDVVSPREGTFVQYSKAESLTTFFDVVYFAGHINIGNLANLDESKMWGIINVSVFRERISQGQSLEDFLRVQGKIDHERYCKKYGNADERFPKDTHCHTEIVDVIQKDNGVVLWADGYISSPPHLSKALPDNRVLDFQLGQDGSDGTQWMNFAQDILATATTHTTSIIPE
jgi:hypothetical protein